MEHNVLSSINFIDLAIVGVLLLFIIAGIVRGFTSDLLGLFTWVGALIFTALAFPRTSAWMHHYITHPFFADALSAFLLFLGSLIVLVLVAKSISNLVRRSMLSGLDRSLGIVSGSLRGLVILTLLYLGMLMFWQPGQVPAMVHEARLIHILTTSSQWVEQYLVNGDLFPKRILKHIYGEMKIGGVEQKPHDLVKSLSQPKPGAKPEAEKPAPSPETLKR
jgi:membrane protein required for colicin V production